MPTTKSIPQYVAINATSIVVFDGPPNVAVEWTLAGDGTLSEKSTHTGANGKASARYTPGETLGPVDVFVSYGA